MSSAIDTTNIGLAVEPRYIEVYTACYRLHCEAQELRHPGESSNPHYPFFHPVIYEELEKAFRRATRKLIENEKKWVKYGSPEKSKEMLKILKEAKL